MVENVILFGATGMLGNYCLNILKNKYNVFSILRNDYDILENNYDKLFNIINYYDKAVIINCAGSIPQRGINNETDCYIINSLFPKMLDKIANQLKIKFIHISTNCVFNKCNCNESDMPNEREVYGLSKILGEPENACIIRTSIVGEEIINKKSLLEWVLSNNNGKINGYKNYLWNGCTCLTLVNFIQNILDNNGFWKGIKHIHSFETISKYELVCIINEIYNLNINIIPFDLDYNIDKTLSTIYENTIINKTIKQQIIEQKDFNIYGK